MAEPGRLLAPIAVRLTLAMVAVALAAVALLAVLTLAGAHGDVSQLARQEQRSVASTTAGAVADAFRAAGSWTGTDLHVASSVAADAGAALTVIDATGRSVPVPAGTAGTSRTPVGPVRSAPVVVDSRRVGTAIVHFYRSALPAPEVNLRDALLRTVLAGAGLAALLALLVAAWVSRSISRPLGALSRAVRSMTAGDRSARVGWARRSGELGELAAAFDHMADTIAREDTLRRAVLADVAHELRTPLAVLQAETEALVDELVPPDTERLGSLHDDVLRLARVVDDVDTLASAEAAGLSIRTTHVDLADLASACCASLRRSFEEAGVAMVLHTSAAPAEADPQRIVQVVTNLLTNARKFTGPGGSVEITTGTSAGESWVEVADTGTGIEPDEMPHVFERFWRGRQAGRLAGSGVGLAVVKSLVDAHGGRAEITSDASTGTRVRVTLPTG